MKKNNSYRTIEICSLIVAVIGLTLGFAAYSTSVKVDKLHVKPNEETFSVRFSSSEENDDENKTIRAVAYKGAKVESARIASSRKTAVANLKARFTEPGQKVIYTLYAHNSGIYDAFLRTITFANVIGANSSRVCRPYSSNTSANLVLAACDDITLTVEVGDVVKTSGSLADIDSHSLEVGDKEPIIITIEYLPGGDRADGEFEVEFGVVTLTYLAIDNDGHKKIQSRIQD